MQRACDYSSRSSSNLRVKSASKMCPEVNRHAPPSSDTIQTKPFPIRGMLIIYQNAHESMKLERKNSISPFSDITRLLGSGISCLALNT